jgi:hypothetical protein
LDIFREMVERSTVVAGNSFVLMEKVCYDFANLAA